MRRSGQGMPPSGAAVVSQIHAPAPAAAAMPPTVKLRLVKRCIFSLSVEAARSFGSFMARSLHDDQFITGDHGAKIVPTGPDDLSDMNDEKEHVTERQPEVLGPCPSVAAKYVRQPCELRRFIDRQPREERARAHQDHAGVGQPLGAIELARGSRASES